MQRRLEYFVLIQGEKEAQSLATQRFFQRRVRTKESV